MAKKNTALTVDFTVSIPRMGEIEVQLPITLDQIPDWKSGITRENIQTAAGQHVAAKLKVKVTNFGKLQAALRAEAKARLAAEPVPETAPAPEPVAVVEGADGSDHTGDETSDTDATGE